MANKQIKIKLKGDSSDNEKLRFYDFINQLDAVRTTLSRLESELSEPGSSPLQYNIVDLSHQSPATVLLEVVPGRKGPDVSALLVDKFVGGLKSIKGGIIPEDYDSDLLEPFKKIGPQVSKKNLHRHLSLVSIEVEDDKIEMEESLETKIDEIVGPDEIVQGSISGMLELLNIHSHVNTFRIYPIVGPKKVDCHFKSNQLSNAIAGINHHVNVIGDLRYKRRDKFPYAVNDAVIEIYPDEEDLPSIFDLKGIAPNATGETISEEFVRRLRNDSW
jgi:hypothetical protein